MESTDILASLPDVANLQIIKGNKAPRGDTPWTMVDCAVLISANREELSARINQSIDIDTTGIKELGVPIIFVIGGPGAGKRTLCMKVAEKYGFDDIIFSDVIRTEVSKRTEKAFALARLLSEGQLVPAAILVELIAAKMLQHVQDTKGFIVSGFPREKCQAKLFDKEVRRPDLVLMLNVRNSVMSDRLMAKSVKATERLSINFEYIKKQIENFHKRNKLIVKYYRNLVVVTDAEPDTMTVFEKACESIDNILVEFPGFEANRAATSNAARSRVASK